MGTLKDLWKGRPGHRFQGRYHARRKPEVNGLNRAVRTFAGVVLVIVGAAFLVLPGPGIPPLLFGAALLAGESLSVAKWLDSFELRLRHWRK